MKPIRSIFFLSLSVKVFYSCFFIIILFSTSINFVFSQSASNEVSKSQNFTSSSTTNASNSFQAKATTPHQVFATDKGAYDKADVLGIQTRFIENVGQYGDTLPMHGNLGKILFGYEGLDMPVLFTSNCIIHLQRKVEQPSKEAKEKMERKGVSAEDIARQIKTTNRVITMQWLNANADVEIIKEDLAQGYSTYGMLPNKATGYKKITYHNLYNGIDLVYSFNQNNNVGYEYSLLLKPGADLSKVKISFGGDVKSIRKDRRGNLIIKSDIEGITQTIPVSYFAENKTENINKAEKLYTTFSITDNELSFKLPDNYDRSKSLVIDPFVTGTGSFTGGNAGKAKDVDFDYAGNIYVTGGGNGTVYQMAKYSATGVLQWTFSGSLAVPYWNFGTYYGGWVVEKTTGNVYLGQGFEPAAGFRVIRLNTTGIYDNYISTANASFREDWKMYWMCFNGFPQIIIAGGGTNSNINLGICNPPSTVITSVNVTNIPYSGGTGWAQDISDIIIDPVTYELYSIYGSLYGTPSLSNRIYKNTQPYGAATVAWNITSGYTVIQEIANRPYLVGPQIDNSSNVFAINASYLFYWDGKNLKAFNKASGAVVGTPLTLPNTVLMSGGIIADQCNNIFIGSTNGTIKVYSFNGSVFNDAPADISIAGFGTKSVYDLAFNEPQKLLYASGDGFVAAIDVTSYGCSFNSYTLTVTPNCVTSSATVTISPTPPSGSTVTYTLFNGAIQVASNTTGVFNGLNTNITYNIIATVNQVCSGIQTNTSFVLSGPTLSVSQTNATCGNADGTITATGSGSIAPYTYSIDGVTYVGSGIFASLTGGLYTVTVKDANGCKSSAQINIINTNGPSLTFTKTDAACGGNDGTITATGTGGTPPLQYSINGTTFQTNNFFTGLTGGTYTLTVKDFNGCTNVATVVITNYSGAILTAIPTSSTCNNSNGSITVIAIGGTAPLEYSINGNTFQSGNIFSNLAAAVYTVTVRDSNGCIISVVTTVANSTGPTVTAVGTSATCGNTNGSITATGTGIIPPLMYSLNGGLFQSSNLFTGLAIGIYTVTVKDGSGCTNTVTVNLAATNAPTATATSVSATCNSSNGSITAAGSAGTAPYQYSINGITFQASTLFTGLSAGVYIVLVKDAIGCIGTTVVTVGNTAGPALTATASAVSCTVNDGVITASGSGGTAPLQYSINGGALQPGNTFSNLAVGVYTVRVTDANGCTKSVVMNVVSASGLSLTASSITASCNGNNGSITAIAIGGSLPLQYSIDGITYQNSNVFNSLGTGLYTVTVLDANGCTVTATVTVNLIATPQVTVTSTNANCANNNGTITATGTGGTGSLQYSINGTTFQTTNVFNNIAPATYTVTVKDANGCTNTTNVTITTSGVGPGITSFTVAVTGTFPCDGNAPGKITNPKVNGATCSTCTYSLNGAPFVANQTQLFLNLPVGTYTVVAMTAAGCTKAITVVLGIEPNASCTAVVTGTACGTNNGSIFITCSGINTPYHASIDGGVTWANFGGSPGATHLFSGLAPGIYTITMEDDATYGGGNPGGCFTYLTVVVPGTGGPTISLAKNDGTCGLSNGIITATGTGAAPLTYSLDGGSYQGSNIFTGVAAGLHTVVVQDATGCINSSTVTVANPGGPVASALASGATCNLNNGSITVTGNGGAAPLQYSINGTTFQTSTSFTGLAPGTYTVTVGDAAACFSTSVVTVPKIAVPAVTAYTVAATCNNSDGNIVAIGASGTPPYLYSIDGIVFQSSNIFTGLPAGFYTVTIQDNIGCLNTTGVNVANLAGPLLTVATPVTAKCGNANGSVTATTVTGGTLPLSYSIDGINFQSGNTFTGLNSGTYTLTVKDVNGCLSTKTVLVGNTNGPQVLTATSVHAKCGNNNGSITAAASGGVAPLTYSINGTTFQGSTVFSLLASGFYTVTVKDANGCTKTLGVAIVNLTGPSVTDTTSPASCYKNDGTITAIATGGTGALTYSLNGVTFQSSNIFLNLPTSTYTVTVKDINTCTSTCTAIVSTIVTPIVSASAVAGTCGATGTITAVASSGAAPYLYSINGITFQSSPVFACIPSGTYFVYLQDANGCFDTTAVLLPGSPLPVSLLNFNAVADEKNNVVNLKWSTVTEINSHHFTVEKSKDGRNFETVLIRNAAGNSSNLLNYFDKDLNPYQGISFYRLKQTDVNGQFTYSDIVSVIFNGNTSTYFYPNPFTDELNISSSQSINQVKIVDVTGRVVRGFSGHFNSKIKFDLQDITPGCYTLKVLDSTGNETTSILIKE